MSFFKKKLPEENTAIPAPIENTVKSESRPTIQNKTKQKNLKTSQEEEREDEIEESLEEIYKDEDGQVVDVRHFTSRRRGGFVFWFLSTIFFLAVLVGLGYGAYYLYLNQGSDSNAVTLTLEAEEKIMAGEEFFVTVDYSNTMNIKVKNARLEAVLPDSFVVLESQPEMGENKSWDLGDLTPHSSGEIKIKGKIINTQDSSNLLLARLTYTPENFSSEFKKEASQIVTVSDIGVSADFVYSSSALVNSENEINVKLKSKEKNYLSNFRIVLEPNDSIQIIDFTEEEKKKLDPIFKEVNAGVWEVSNLSAEEKSLPLKYKYTQKASTTPELIVHLAIVGDDNKVYNFVEQKVAQDLVKSDLNLSLEINGQNGDGTVNFADQLNYLIKYKNVGQGEMKDLVIMAVLDGDGLDWNTLENKSRGVVSNNAITWSKDQIPVLSSLPAGESGEINFSVKVKDFRSSDLSGKFEISSYAQYSIGNAEEFKNSKDTQSNTIINKINSNFSLKEELRYFNEDNLPVGSGPLPPQVGQVSTFKVYWKITNDLHELRDAKVELSLPDSVVWAEKNRASVGSVSYDRSSNKVIWTIGRLPVSVYQADAEFSISVTPKESDRDRIMVLLPGSQAVASDSATGAILNLSTKPKTTRLEDDDIASVNNDGQVR